MITRRSFLAGTAASTALLACRKGPMIRTPVPIVTHGVQTGDVGDRRATIWARCNEPARMVVEYATTASFAQARRVAGAVVGPDRDHTGELTLTDLPMGERVSYRVRFEREADRGASAWVSGSFATPRADKVRFAWSGDTCGQGYGRNPDFGGLVGYKTLRAREPDFFLHSGDLIYADNPILAEQKTPDGRIWRNVTNERVGRVAQELDDFRARFAYNYEDEHVRALAADVSILAAWDDHETHNNWWPGQTLDDARYTRERDATKLAAMAMRATREWTPIRGPSIHRVISYGPLLDVFVVDLRSWRTPNDANRGEGAMLGMEQAAWLLGALARSQARWKIIACDQPISLVIGDGPGDARQEGYANGAAAGLPPAGREKELRDLLAGIDRDAIDRVVWLTADVHYAAHHHYDPARANTPFRAFHEFVAGPIHAGTFGPNELDPTFGPELKFQWAPSPGTGNLAPWDGLQSFGVVDITADAMRVSLVGAIDGRERYAIDLPAMR